jgi:hypothetical protein
LLLQGFTFAAVLAAGLDAAASVGAGGCLLLQGFVFAAVVAAGLDAAASVGAKGCLSLQGFTFAAVLAAGLGEAASDGAAGGLLLQGLGFPVTVAEGDASGSFLSWPQPLSNSAITMAPANRFNVCYSQAARAVEHSSRTGASSRC